MAYDAVAESLRLIESRELVPVTRLSRRRRHAAMALDVSESIAVTMFARRSVGCSVEEIHVFARHGGEWVLLGGGGGSAVDDALGHRPADLSAGLSATTDVDAHVLVQERAGGILDSRAKGVRSPLGQWINYGVVRVNADVARLVVDGRQIAVPWHGRCVVAWPGRRAKELAIIANDGRQLGRVVLRPS
ncbi:MAG: hypothetical protein ACTHWA_10465 [Arachnia sp.]